jgi:hypothetical protein
MKSAILNLAGVIFLLCSYAKADEYPYLRRIINGEIFSIRQVKTVQTEDSGMVITTETLKPKKKKNYRKNMTLMMEGSGVSSPIFTESREHLEGEFPERMVFKYLSGPHILDETANLVVPQGAKVTVDLDYCLGKYMDLDTYSRFLGGAEYKIDLGGDNGYLSFILINQQLQGANFDKKTKTNVDDRVQVEDQTDDRKLNLNPNLSDFKKEIMGLLDSKIQEFSARFNLPLDSPSNTSTQKESIL